MLGWLLVLAAAPHSRPRVSQLNARTPAASNRRRGFSGLASRSDGYPRPRSPNTGATLASLGPAGVEAGSVLSRGRGGTTGTL